MNRSNKILGPIFECLADHYVFPGAYSKALMRGVGVQTFKQKVKSGIIQYINHEIEPYARKLPFLKIDSSSTNDGNDCVLQFDKHLQNYMTTRRITSVMLHHEGSYMLPLSAAEARRRGVLGSKRGGFEISLMLENAQRMLTSFSHEIGHTYFYDISADPPRFILPDVVLKEREWYAQFEGLAYDFGREVLLPRRIFQEYVRRNHTRPSLRNFLMMCDELKVSKEILSQRLLHDMKLWNACIFWGTVANNPASLQHVQQGPQIVVRNRDKRKAEFPNLSLGKELASATSELRRIILERRERGTHEGVHIVVAEIDFLIDVENRYLPSGDRYFTALLYTPDILLTEENARGKQLSINVSLARQSIAKHNPLL